MDSIDPAKKRKAASDPPRPGNDDAGTTLPANLSLADLNSLINQRVTEVVEAETRALTSRVDCLQRENEGLLLRCESLERSVQVLKQEANWTYSAPGVPRSHWIDQGHDEEYAEAAESLIRSIKDKTNDLRSGDVDDVVLDPETRRILSDNALGPHWEQLANAIQLSERITKLNFSKVQLDQGTLQMIEASVRQKGIAQLHLYDNQFHGGEAVQFAIDVLESNRTVGSFYWEDNSFRSTEDACKLVDAVLGHPMIGEVSFEGSFREGVTTYSPVQRLFGGVGTDTLLGVDLTNNDIKTNGDRCIPDFLSTNPPLKYLVLWYNRLNDDDALRIAVALQSNTNLRYLDLDDNALTGAGKDAMYHQAVLGISPSDLSALHSLSEADLNIVGGANHTCRIAGISNQPLMNDREKSAKFNRRRKLFRQLAIRHLEGCNVPQLEAEFSEEGVRIVPHVLACVNRYCCEEVNRPQDCISILFELARDWKTPEIYQFHQT